MVWLTGGALVAAVGMIIALLVAVLIFGGQTSWPLPVEQYDLGGYAVMGEVTRTETYEIDANTLSLMSDEERTRVEADGGGRGPGIRPVLDHLRRGRRPSGGGPIVELQLWVRVPGGDELDERQRQIVLAFLSDGPLMFNSTLPHGVAMETHWATTIDQASWFHRPADPSQWMLFDQRSTAAADGRGMNEGRIFTADGVLLMTCVQESMLRKMPSS